MKNDFIYQNLKFPNHQSLRTNYLCTMQEFFFTILSIWVIWRVFSSFSGTKTTSRTYQQTNHNYYSGQKKQEGEVRIETKATPESKIPPTEGEYVDYEEIK